MTTEKKEAAEMAPIAPEAPETPAIPATPVAPTKDIRETGELTPLMIKFAVPCVISLLVGSLYNIVDQIFIANADYLGSFGNAANTVVYPMTVICLAIAVAFGDGDSSFLSISLGAHEHENAHRSVGSCLVSVTCIGIVIAAIYLIFREPLVTLFGGRVNEETFRLANQYFFWIALGVPFYMFGQATAGIVSADGSPAYTMRTTMTGAVINIILDPIFIYVFRWGMAGAAIATILGQIAVAFIFLAYLPKMKSLTLTRDSFKPRFSLIKRLVPLGMNSFFAQISIVLSIAAVNNMVTMYSALDPVFGQAEYSQIPLAVIGIVIKFFQIVISVSVGMGAGSIPVVGYNVGAKKNDRVIGILKRLLVAELVLGVCACFVFEVFPRQLIGLFGAANESQYYTDFALKAIRILLSMIALGTVNKGFSIFVQALGKAKEAIILSVLREIVLGVGLVLLLPRFFGLTGILFFMPLADLCTMAFTLYFLVRIYRELSRPVAASQVLLHPAAPVGDPKTSCIITIGRSYGAGGKTIARALAERLNIAYYNDKLLEMAAEESGVNQHLLESYDEKPARMNLLYSAMGYSRSTDNAQRTQALKAQTEIIERVAAAGPCVIVGRRADQVLRDNPRLFSVFISGSEELRATRIAERDGLSLSESRRKIAQVDRERAQYYNLHSEKKWGEAATYDLCIDTDKIGMEGAEVLILSAVARLG